MKKSLSKTTTLKVHSNKDHQEVASELIRMALTALPRARAPYSHFQVAAAIRTENGDIYCGVNIENSSYGLTICAERVAIFKAISEGESAFSDIAIVTSSGIKCPPCGACRQVLWDLAPNLRVILAVDEQDYHAFPLKQLLPMAFDDKLLL